MHLIAELFQALPLQPEQEIITEFNGYLMKEVSAAEIVNKAVVNKLMASAVNGQYLQV